MRIGLFASATPGAGNGIEDIVEFTRTAEALGFDSIWLANVFGLDAVGACAVAGRETERIEVGTAVTPTYPRHPAALAQQAQDIEPGQPISGALSPGDRAQYGRVFDDYLYAAAPGTQAYVVVQSSEMAVDVNIYFYDDYYDLIPLIAGGSEAKDSLEFTVPDVDSRTLVVIRVTTRADDPGPATGPYTVTLSER